MNLSLSFLDDASPQQVKALSPEQLQALKQCLDEDIARNKARKRVLEGGLRLKYHDAAKLALNATHRDTGTTHIYDGNLVIIAELPKKVDWDQKLLIPIVETLSPDVRLPGLSMAYSIHETHYKAWDPHIQKLFDPARTITIGTPSFTFEEPKQ